MQSASDVRGSPSCTGLLPGCGLPSLLPWPSWSWSVLQWVEVTSRFEKNTTLLAGPSAHLATLSLHEPTSALSSEISECQASAVRESRQARHSVRRPPLAITRSTASRSLFRDTATMVCSPSVSTTAWSSVRRHDSRVLRSRLSILPSPHGSDEDAQKTV